MKKTNDWKYCIIDWLKMINQLVLEKNILENTKTKWKWYTKKDYIEYFNRLEKLLNEIDNTCIMIYWN
jgi:hypothetical protein